VVTGYAACPRCHARIIWVTLAGGRTPLDRTPHDQGETWAYQNAAGGWEARVAVPGEILAAPWKRHAIHPAACTPPAGEADVTQLDTWRAAESAHKAARRRGRGKRAAPPIAGYRVRRQP
jgi:hypothetical protein